MQEAHSGRDVLQNWVQNVFTKHFCFIVENFVERTKVHVFPVQDEKRERFIVKQKGRKVFLTYIMSRGPSLSLKAAPGNNVENKY